jgi:hypothetical protein
LRERWVDSTRDVDQVVEFSGRTESNVKEMQVLAMAGARRSFDNVRRN